MNLRQRLSLSAISAAAGAAIAFAAFGVAPAAASHLPFVTLWCKSTRTAQYAPQTRVQALNIVLKAYREGYQWGGGCYNDNDRDDSPNDPPQDVSTRGEGPDCSGFVFRAWMLAESTSSTAFYWYTHARNIHGPYATTHYKYAQGAPLRVIAKSSADFWDAFVSTGHIGLVYGRNSDGTDMIFEAKGEAYGTNVWARSYRGTSSYSAAARRGWAG